jgi:hypothetical protein
LWFRDAVVSRILFVAFLAVACTSQPAPNKSQEVPSEPVAVAPAEPVAPEEPVEPEEPEEPESIEVELRTEKFEADLDADGRTETISWTCSNDAVALSVGQAKYKAKLGFSDLIGCVVAIIDLDPEQPNKQLWLHADEHDEAGPNRNFFLHHGGAGVEEIWTNDLDFELFADGSWRTEASECDDAKRVHRTTITIWRWRDGNVVDEPQISTVPFQADERCPEPSEP